MKARKLRDYYTHLDINEPRCINTTEVIKFLESVLLAIIWPSTVLNRTIFLGVYHLHGMLMELSKLATNHTEQPLHKDWPSQGDYVFHCNFVNVDTERFANSQ